MISLVSAWLAYFFIHSLMASLWLKHKIQGIWPKAMPVYRLVFNLLAVFLLLVPLGILFSARGNLILDWSGVWQWVSHGLALLALMGFVWSTRFYDSNEFLGIRQFKQKIESVEDQETFQLSPMHRYVRHPWYFLGLILIWTRDMDIYFLVSACLMTLYFIAGSWMEERKLCAYHGLVYQRYRQKVAGLIPLPWKMLSRVEAEKLVNQ